MIFTCKNFVGHYPVGAAAVIVAESEDEARRLLVAVLLDVGLPQTAAVLELLPLDPDVRQVRVLVDGNY